MAQVAVTSTTVQDALYLGERVMRRLIEQFVEDEVAGADEPVRGPDWNTAIT